MKPTPHPLSGSNLSSAFSLAGHAALITGSSRGIGRALALAFAEYGADVAVHGWEDQLEAAKVTAAIAALGRRTCALDSDLVVDDGAKLTYHAAVQGLGRAPDILVCNVATQFPTDWLAITREQFDRQVALNFRSNLELCQLAAPAMIAARWGRILTIGSVQEVRPHPRMLVYAGTKCAQTSMAINLAKQLAPHGITVNNLAPGIILTERNIGLLADPVYAEQRRLAVPLGYFGESHDCAGAALLLCSQAGHYITGQSLYVDGGMSLP